MRFFLLVVIATSFSLLPCLVMAQGDCASQAKTELEKVYCEIAATPEVRTLPSFSDFRRNPPKVQALLLKGPARKLRIDLPTADVQPRAPANPNPNRAAAPTNTQTSSSRPAALASPKVARIDPPKAPVPEARNIVPPRSYLSACQFKGEIIQCPGRSFRLLNNLQNHQLAIGVLDPSNKLSLPSFTGSVNNDVAVNNYLADSYEYYIGKMLEIGLGASTMTYTKFHYTFWDLHKKNEDFASRVGKMYEYLKQDKASMAVKSRYDNQLPDSLDWCQDLNSLIIVCDNGKRNWVYRN